MHASVHQLLNLRDGQQIAASSAEHVASCAHCTHELARLAAIRDQLGGLPSVPTSPEEEAALWRRVQASAAVSTAPGQSLNRYLAIAAALVWIGVAVVWFVFADGDGAPQPMAREQGTPAVTRNIDALVFRSQQLESYLEQLPRPRLERAASAATADALEGRIQWLDYALSADGDAGVPPEQAAALWQERVELLGSLVTLRYAQVERVSF